MGGHPIYGPMLRNRELLKKIFQAYMIPADEVMLTDDEIDAVLAARRQQQRGGRRRRRRRAGGQGERMELENKKLEMQVALANQ